MNYFVSYLLTINYVVPITAQNNYFNLVLVITDITGYFFFKFVKSVKITNGVLSYSQTESTIIHQPNL